MSGGSTIMGAAFKRAIAAAGEATGPAYDAIRRAVADHERAIAMSVVRREEMASTNDAPARAQSPHAVG